MLKINFKKKIMKLFFWKLRNWIISKLMILKNVGLINYTKKLVKLNERFK